MCNVEYANSVFSFCINEHRSNSPSHPRRLPNKICTDFSSESKVRHAAKTNMKTKTKKRHKQQLKSHVVVVVLVGFYLCHHF